MASLVSIVEGHGEVQAVPVLIRKIRDVAAPGFAVHVPQGVRAGREGMVHAGGIERYVEGAVGLFQEKGAILILLDADDDAPDRLEQELLARASAARGDVPMAVVVANREYESWFLAGAESLRGWRGLPADLQPPEKPDEIRGAKEWLSDRLPKGKPYAPARHQAALTQLLDFELARSRSESFDKCYREVVRLLNLLQPPAAPPESPPDQSGAGEEPGPGGP